MSTIVQIVSDHLRAIGADGLCDLSCDCSCELSDLSPCGGFQDDCRPGWKGAPPDMDAAEAWRMYPSKQAADAATGAPQ